MKFFGHSVLKKFAIFLFLFAFVINSAWILFKRTKSYRKRSWNLFEHSAYVDQNIYNVYPKIKKLEDLQVYNVTFLDEFRNPCWLEKKEQTERMTTQRWSDVQRLPAMAAKEVGVLRCLPLVFLIGMPKCGTTDLYEKIAAHPHLVATQVKGIHWWSRTRFDTPPKTFEDYIDNFDNLAHKLEHRCLFQGNFKKMCKDLLTMDGSASTMWYSHDYNAHIDNVSLPLKDSKKSVVKKRKLLSLEAEDIVSMKAQRNFEKEDVVSKESQSNFEMEVIVSKKSLKNYEAGDTISKNSLNKRKLMSFEESGRKQHRELGKVTRELPVKPEVFKKFSKKEPKKKVDKYIRKNALHPNLFNNKSMGCYPRNNLSRIYNSKLKKYECLNINKSPSRLKTSGKVKWEGVKSPQNKNPNVINKQVTKQSKPKSKNNRKSLMKTSEPKQATSNSVGKKIQTISEHIHRILPDSKIIAILRNPVERLYSDYKFFHPTAEKSAKHFHMLVRSSLEIWKKCIDQKSVRKCAYSNKLHKDLYGARLHMGLYSVYLNEWLTKFPRRNVLVLRLEDYGSDIKRTLNRVYSHLGLRNLTSEEWDAILSQHNLNRNDVSTHVGPMFSTTRKLLDEFYQPFNKELSQLLRDDRFRWL